MLFRYIKNYRFRFLPILLYLLVLFSSCFILGFTSTQNVQKALGIIDSYNDVSFKYGYVLNYSIEQSEYEYIYSDTDILFYTSESKEQKLVISSIMVKETCEQELCLHFDLKKIDDCHQVIVPSNVANKYKLTIGDHLYCEYSYVETLVETTIVDISKPTYDFDKRAVSNDVGLVCIGYNTQYVKNTKCKYVILSNYSQANLISNYPQILKETFGVNDFILTSLKYLVTPSLLFLLSSIALLLAYHLFIGKKTLFDLMLLHAKGLTKQSIRLFAFAELFIFFVLLLSLAYLPFILLKDASGLIVLLFIVFISLIEMAVYSLLILVKTKGVKKNDFI